MSAAPLPPLPPLNRRHWLTLALTSLSGCGGGDSSTAGVPGTGGTGMYAVGTIQGFGSVIVNGVQFDDTLASIRINGQTLSSAELRLGMVAQIHGARSTTTATQGTAEQIVVWSIAQGTVDRVSSTQCTVAGMTLNLSSRTVYDGLSAATLAVGQRITVWGLQADQDASHWSASRIALSSASTVVSTGLLQRSGGQTTLNGIPLSGAALDSISTGSLLWVEGNLGSGGTLSVSRSVLLDTGLPRSGEAEVEGVVTALGSGQRFTLGTVPIDASALTLSSPVALGQRIEVSGRWQEGVLIATELELEDEDQQHEVEIEAAIQSYTSLSDFVVRHQRCNASGVTQIENGSAADLKVGVLIKVKGTLSGDVLMVTELEIKD